MDAMVTHMINIAALALTTASLNAGIVSANNAVSQLHEPKFLFNTVGDDRVCPICEPFDNETMKELTARYMNLHYMILVDAI